MLFLFVFQLTFSSESFIKELNKGGIYNSSLHSFYFVFTVTLILALL